MSKRMNEALRVLARHGKLLREQAESPIDYEHPADVEAEEDAWAGGDNIALQLDIANLIHGADEQVTEPEVMELRELRRIINLVMDEVALPTGEVAYEEPDPGPGLTTEPSSGLQMEMMVEDLVDVGWINDDIHVLERLYDYIEDNHILDMNDISLGPAGPQPDSGAEMQYHGSITLEDITGSPPRGKMDPRGLGSLDFPEDDPY